MVLEHGERGTDMFTMIGGTNPDFSVHGVRISE